MVIKIRKLHVNISFVFGDKPVSLQAVISSDKLFKVFCFYPASQSLLF